jgi:hypothetical protein
MAGLVMAGLVPATHEHYAGKVRMDPRDKPEDDGGRKSKGWPQPKSRPWKSGWT